MAGRVNYFTCGAGTSTPGTEGSFTRTVLVAVDASSQAEAAFDWYMKCFHRPENRLLLLHVPEHKHLELSSDVKLSSAEVNQLVECRKREVADMVAKYQSKFAGTNVTATFRTLHGKSAGEVIVDEARSEDANLVVIATRGLGTVRRTLLGSVSDFVVQHAHVPVIVYRNVSQ